MLMRGHLVVALAFGLVFLPNVSNKLLFLPVLLIASLIPDLDVTNSYVGNNLFLRPFQWFIKHRGFIHSLTFCAVISFVLAFFLPVLALPFFLGYASHLLVDSFTVEGIRPFWPMKKEVAGILRVGGKTESGLFYMFVLIDVLLVIRLFL